MNFLRLKSTNPLYRQRFGDTDIKNFEVYTERKEAIGKISDVLTDETQRAYYLVVEIGSWLSRKQVLLPLSRFEVAPAERRLYAVGVSKADVENLPLYVAREVKSDELHTTTSTSDVHPVSILEASPPIEASLPLETDAMVVPVVRSVGSTVPVVEPVATPIVKSVDEPVAAPLPVSSQHSSELAHTGLATPSAAHTVAEETVRLLEERLIVGRQKRKVGEVIVRKAVETRMVEVPVRWERLIVEQVSPERKQLASIDLHQEIDPEAISQNTLDTLELREPTSAANGITNGTSATQYIPINLANQVLYKLSQFPQFSTAQVQMSFADPELQAQYQRWLTERKTS
jgi:stress response protein YsnF